MEIKIEITTIKIKKETKARLDKLKIHKGETYEDIIRKILGILNICKTNPYQARIKLSQIDILRKKLDS